MRRVVVLPAPLGPRNPVICPGRTSKVSSSTTRIRPNCLVRPWTEIGVSWVVVMVFSDTALAPGRDWSGRGEGRWRGDRAVRIGVSDAASAGASVTFRALRILRIVRGDRQAESRMPPVVGGETQAGS